MNSRKRASIIVISVFIAACALFTAVYDGLKRRDVSPTSILNAATVNHTGENAFSVMGTAIQCDTATELEFDYGVWMIRFDGQSGGGDYAYYGQGASCLAFYKAEKDNPDKLNKMTIRIGVGGGKSEQFQGFVPHDGGGKTIVTTNFALPDGYKGTFQAMASGAGGRSEYGMDWCRSVGLNPQTGSRNGDGTFYRGRQTSDSSAGGTASQFEAGESASEWMVNRKRVKTPNAGEYSGSGGGAGYYDGGAGYDGTFTLVNGDLGGCASDGGGGSCTPWCYPVVSWDNQVNNVIWDTWDNGGVGFYKISPTEMPVGAEVNLAEDPEATAEVTAGGVGAYTPVSALQASSSAFSSFSCGIETGWVFRWRRL